MNLAYIILAYKNPNQVLRLVNSLTVENSYFFIHIDKRVNIKIFRNEFSKSVSKKKNIFFVKQENSRWGSIGCVNAVLNCMQTALESGEKFDYFFNISGQDYPIIGNDQIIEFVKNNINKIYIKNFELPSNIWKNGGLDRINGYHLNLFDNKKLIKITHRLLDFLNLFLPKRRFPDYLKPYGGEFYFCLPADAVQYILDFLKEHPDYLTYHKFTYIPEEIFFHSILLNNESFKKNNINESPVYIDWSRKPFPATLVKDDFNKIISSGKIFARKFDQSIDAEILNMVDISRNKKI